MYFCSNVNDHMVSTCIWFFSNFSRWSTLSLSYPLFSSSISRKEREMIGDDETIHTDGNTHSILCTELHLFWEYIFLEYTERRKERHGAKEKGLVKKSYTTPHSRAKNRYGIDWGGNQLKEKTHFPNTLNLLSPSLY